MLLVLLHWQVRYLLSLTSTPSRLFGAVFILTEAKPKADKPKTKPKADKPAPVTPIGLREFGTQAHTYAQFNAYVPDGTTKDDLINPKLWVNVAARLKMGSEIRAMPEDLSFVARLVVLYQLGSEVRLGLESFTEFGATDVESPDERYQVVPYGAQGKYAVKDTADNKLLFKSIATRSQAYRQIEEHIRALAS